MHVRTDHINRHASVSGSYEDSTGAISNGAAQFSVISPNLRAFGKGLYAGSIDKVDVLVMRFDDGGWYSAKELKERTCAATNQRGLLPRYDDGEECVHTKLDIEKYNVTWYFITEDN